MTLAEPHVPGSHNGEPVSQELRPLLLAVYQRLKDRPTDIPGLAASLLNMLSFLASPAGRTNANCKVAGYFFLLGQGWEIEGWDHVPEPLGDIIAEIGMSLHDTVSSPETAQNFDGTPEQLLVRLRRAMAALGAA